MGTKFWIALAAVVVVLMAGVAFALTRPGDEPKATPTSENAPQSGQAGAATTAASPEASAQQVQDMLNSITSQLAQATNNGGQPKAITAQEVEAMLRQQQQQLGIK